MLILSTGSITTPILRAIFLLPHHPRAREEIVPGALLAAPDDPENAKADACQTQSNGANPAQERAPVSDLLPLQADDAKVKDALADGLPVHTVKHHEISCGEKDPRQGEQ